MDILKAVTLIISMCTIVAGLYLIIISSRSKNKKWTYVNIVDTKSRIFMLIF